MNFAINVFVFMFPGIMYFWVFFLGQIPMQEILDERDAHTLQRLLAAPVTVLQFLLSKMLRCFLLCGLIQMLLLAAMPCWRASGGATPCCCFRSSWPALSR